MSRALGVEREQVPDVDECVRRHRYDEFRLLLDNCKDRELRTNRRWDEVHLDGPAPFISVPHTHEDERPGWQWSGRRERHPLDARTEALQGLRPVAGRGADACLRNQLRYVAPEHVGRPPEIDTTAPRP